MGASRGTGETGAGRGFNARWEWPADEIRRVGYRAVDMIAEHLVALPEEPVFRPVPAELASQWLGSEPPESGAEADDVLDAFARDIEPFPFGNGHPRFYGWVNSPPVVLSVFAEALAAAMNPSCAGGNHAAVYVERAVVNWFKQIVGFPAASMGLLVSGGSMAALTALAVARQVKCGFDVRARGMQGAPAKMTCYRSGEGHGCHQKAIELLGIGHEDFRVVEHDRALCMKPAALGAAIAADREQGNVPIAVIASAGAVNTGAFEPQSLSIVCFRFAPRVLRQEAEVIDRVNKALLEEIQLGGQVFLSSTMIDGKFWLRACIVNHRAQLEDLETLVDVVTCSGRAAKRRMDEATAVGSGLPSGP